MYEPVSPRGDTPVLIVRMKNALKRQHKNTMLWNWQDELPPCDAMYHMGRALRLAHPPKSQPSTSSDTSGNTRTHLSREARSSPASSCFHVQHPTASPWKMISKSRPRPSWPSANVMLTHFIFSHLPYPAHTAAVGARSVSVLCLAADGADSAYLHRSMCDCACVRFHSCVFSRAAGPCIHNVTHTPSRCIMRARTICMTHPIRSYLGLHRCSSML